MKKIDPEPIPDVISKVGGRSPPTWRGWGIPNMMKVNIAKTSSGDVCENHFTARAITRLSFELQSSRSVQLDRNDEI